MPTKQVLKETYEMWYAKGLLHLAKGEREDAVLCFVSAARALSEMSARNSGEAKEIQQNRLMDLITEIDRLKKEIKIEESKEKYIALHEGGEEAVPPTLPEIPKVTFDDVIGLDDAKREVFYKAIYPKKYPELYKRYLMNKGGGILLYGLPGTGKTMIARAIAHETGAEFIPVRCSDIGSKWFGESEQNLRALFEKARSYENAVLFFDEIEAYAGKRRDDSAMSRIVPEFLSQLQGADAVNGGLLVIAATNRPWDLDGAFLRPGRFDDKIFVPLPDKAARQAITESNMKGIPHGEIDFVGLAERTEGYNGADMAYLCQKAKEITMQEIIEQGADDEGVQQKHFEAALLSVKSSVNAEDENQMRAWAKNL